MEKFDIKKSKTGCLICCLLIIFLTGCGGIRDYSREELSVTVPYVIYFGNLTEIIIAPGKDECRIVHEHFNRKYGNAFRVPYSIATVCFPDRKFVVSDKGVGNYAIQIDGQRYSLRKSNPVIHTKYGILWTAENFRQGPNSAPCSPWLFPLKGNIHELLRRAGRQKIKADEYYKREFKRLSQKEGCTGAKIFSSTEWQKYFAAAKNDPFHFEFLLSLFPDTGMTKIHICNWENASQGILAVMTAEKIAGCSWLKYNGKNPLINGAVKKAEKNIPQHTYLKKILTNSVCCRDLQNYFRQVYYNKKEYHLTQQISGKATK